MKTVRLFPLLLLVMAAGCQTTGKGQDQYIFVQSGLTESAFEKDVEDCRQYGLDKGSSDGEKGGAVAFGLILGGPVGAIANNSAYVNSNARIVEECFYRKGYQQVLFPAGKAASYFGKENRFDARQATLDLIRNQQMEELVVWNDAVSSNSPSEKAVYLEQYPNGAFVDDLKLTDNP